jgi:glycosyltransferase involved in cell wall biosynthesis
VFSQTNSGQSNARNFALKQACGDYIFYVDADDKIEKQSLGKLLENATDFQVDILRFSFFNTKKKSFCGEYNQLYMGVDFFVFCKGIWSPCMQLFRREFLTKNNFYFTERITSEDAELLPTVYLQADRCVAVNRNIYYYMYNPTSTTKEKNVNLDKVVKRIHSQLVVLEKNQEMYHKFESKKIKNNLYETVLFPAFTDFCTLTFWNKFTYNEAKNIQKSYHSSVIYPFRIQISCSFKHKLMFYIMNSSVLFDLFYISGLKNIYTKKILN